MTRRHWHCMYPFFQTLTSHLTLNKYHGSTDNNSWKDCHRMTRLQPREKKKSEKKINNSSQRGYSIYKWNFHNFQTPECSSILHSELPFWMLRDCMVCLVPIQKIIIMHKKYWAEIWTKLVTENHNNYSKYWSVLFSLLSLQLPDVFVSTMSILMFSKL